MSISGYTTVSASYLQDATGTLIANATIWFAPVDSNGHPLSFRSGTANEGQVISQPVSALVTNGVFSVQLADTSLTTPVNVGYSVSVIDNNTGKSLLGGGYTCVQPSGSTWSFDTYTPNTLAQSPLLIGLDFRGVYDGTVSYFKNDVVTASGSTYISLVNSNVGNAPATSTSDWSVLASKGDPGAITGTEVANAVSQRVATNLFDSTAATYEQLLVASNGGVTGFADGNYFISDYMAVKPSGTLLCNQSTLVAGSSTWGWCFYDIDRNFLSGVSGVVANTSISIPSNAVFARFCGDQRVGAATTFVVLCNAALPSGYVYPGTSIAASEAIQSIVSPVVTSSLTGSTLAAGGYDTLSLSVPTSTVGCTCFVDYSDGSDTTDGGKVSLKARCSTAGTVIVERRPYVDPFSSPNLIANCSFERPAASPALFQSWNVGDDATGTAPYMVYTVSSTSGEGGTGTAVEFSLISGGQGFPSYDDSLLTSLASFPVTSGEVLGCSARVSATVVAGFPGKELYGRLTVTYGSGATSNVDQMLTNASTTGYTTLSTTFTIPVNPSLSTDKAVSATFTLLARLDETLYTQGLSFNAGDGVFIVDSVLLTRTYTTTTKNVSVRVIV